MNHIHRNVKTSWRTYFVTLDIEHVMGNMVFCASCIPRKVTLATHFKKKKFRNPPYQRFVQYLSLPVATESLKTMETLKRISLMNAMVLEFITFIRVMNSRKIQKQSAFFFYAILSFFPLILSFVNLRGLRDVHRS